MKAFRMAISRLINRRTLLCLCIGLLIITPFIISIADSPAQSYNDFFIRGAHNSLSSFYSWFPEDYGSNTAGSVWRLAPLSLIYVVLTNLLKLSSGVSQLIVCGFLFIVCYVSYIKVVPLLLHRFKLSKWAVGVTGFFYLFNTYSLTQFADSFLLVIPYLLLPAQIYFLLRAFSSKKYVKYAILFALINAACFGINLIFDVISILVLATVAYIVLNKGHSITKKKVILFFVGVYGLTLLLCSFWLVPQIYSSLTDPSTTQYILKSEQFYNSDSSILNVLRGLGYWGFFSGQNGVPYNSFANAYKNNILVIVIGFILPALAFVSLLLFTSKQGTKKSVILLGSALAIVMVAIVGTYPAFPTSIAVQAIFNYVPFSMAFRNTYKFASIEMLLLGLMLTLTFSKINLWIPKKRKWITGIIAVIAVAFVFVNAFPYFRNEIYSNNLKIHPIPSYWTQTAEYVSKNNSPKDAYIFMLPNQYFEALSWSGGLKTFTRNLEETLFGPNVVHNTCAGCSEYYTSSFLTNAYNNLSTPGIFKLLGLTGNSLIVQRNDYDSSYYNVQTPAQIKSILTKASDVKKLKTIGKLDIYKINSKEVNRIIYSPKKIVATNYLDEFPTMANQNAKSTTLILSSTISSNDSYTLNHSNYYQGVLSSNNTVVSHTKASSTIYTPRHDSYSLASTTANTSYQVGYTSTNGTYDLILHRLTSPILINNKRVTTTNTESAVNIPLGNYSGASIVVELQNHALLLTSNNENNDIGNFSINSINNSIKVYSTQNMGKNLVSNGSLEDGLWQTQVSDCAKTASNAALSMRLVKGNASNGNVSLELSAKQDAACTYTPALTNFQSGTYYFTLDSKRIAGGNPSYCVWNGRTCVIYSEINATKNWSTYSNAVYLDSSASNFYLYLYAQKANFIQTTDAYDNVGIYHLTDPIRTINYSLPTVSDDPQRVSLNAGKQVFETNLDLNSTNLIQNANFSAGLWQSSVQNCSDNSGTSSIAMKVVKNSQEGTALDLSTDGFASACTSSAYISNYNQSSTYLLSLKYRVLVGKSAEICVWNGRACIVTKIFTPNDNNWHSANELIVPGSSDQPLSVYLYAPDGRLGEDQYTDITMQEVENSFINNYTLSNTHTHTIQSAQVSYEEDNPTRYVVSFTTKKLSLLTYSQSYHPDWKAYVVHKAPHGFFEDLLWDVGLWKRYSIPDSQHIVTNGFSNGWWINPLTIPAAYASNSGKYQIVIDYTPQTLVTLGLVVSGATMLSCLGYLIHHKLRQDKNKKTGKDVHVRRNA